MRTSPWTLSPAKTYKTGEGRRNSRLYQDIPDSQFTPPEGIDGYVHTREWQDAYRPEWLYFCTNPIRTTDAYSKQEKLRSQFCAGRIDGGGVCRRAG